VRICRKIDHRRQVLLDKVPVGIGDELVQQRIALEIVRNRRNAG